MLPALGFLFSPRQKSRGNPREISRQNLLSLCTRKAHRGEKYSSEPTGYRRAGALLGFFCKLGTKWAWKRLSVKGWLWKFPFQSCCLPGYDGQPVCGPRWQTAHYHHPRKARQRSNLEHLCKRVSSLKRQLEGR